MFKSVFESLFLHTLRALVIARYPRLTRWHWRYDGRSRLPNPVVPSTAHDKWFWRKVFDRSPAFVQITDKLGVRDWLTSHNIRIATPEVLWTGDRAEDIPDALLDSPVVIKSNHACGTNIFLPKPPSDREALNAQANAFLKKRHGVREVQWAYSDVVPKLFVEDLIHNMDMEFKIYCFGNRIERVIAIYDRFENTAADIWTPSADGSLQRSDSPTVVAKARAERPLPDVVQKALPIAREIGEHFDHMRVDILSDGDHLWLGELTVYNVGGHFAGVEAADVERMNAVWDLRRSWFLTAPQRGWRGLYVRILNDRLDEAATNERRSSAPSASVQSDGSAPAPRLSQQG